MSAQLSIKKQRLKLWLISEQQSVIKQMKDTIKSNLCIADLDFEISVLEYKLEFIKKQITKLK